MSLHVRSLASGSSGNAFLVRTARSVLLIDAGLSARALERHLRAHSVEPGTLTAIVVSHEHHDHAHGAGPLARRYNVPIVCTAGTSRALSSTTPGVEFQPLHLDGVTVGDAELWSFPLPHDAADHGGILLRHRDWTVGFALDFGHIEPHIVGTLQEADLVVVEANHDREMLLRSPYPWGIKHRIMSDTGHLSNLQAAELLASVGADGRRRDVWLAHLSERANEHPSGVLRIVQNYLDMAGVRPRSLSIAERNRPSATWHSDLALHQSDLFTLP
jgi:phosphoribosyl 1,2-cyclic phosphodiesterase